MRPEDFPVRLVAAAGSKDLDRVRDLFRAYAAEHGPLVAVIFDVQGFQAEVDELPGRYAPPSGSLILAMDGERAAGCVALRDLGAGTCEMKRLYVPPEHRGHGVGRLLVEEVLRRAEQIGYHRMVLDTLPEMAEAIALYHHFGFLSTAPYWSHPTEQAVFMERPLGTMHPTRNRLADEMGAEA